MKLHLTIILTLVLSLGVYGQKNTASLNSKHAAALEQFLSKNKNYGFLSDKFFDQAELKEFRKHAGKTATPYYAVGDFNSDGAFDFAVILSRKGKRTRHGGSVGSPWEFDYPLTVVIFNGNKRGGFTPAFIQNLKVPYVSLLSVEGSGRKKRLYFGVYASDADTMFFSPKGKSYIVEYPETP
jgi:hypothetical protein